MRDHSDDVPTSIYVSAFRAYTQIVQRAFVVAARRLDARDEALHKAVIGSFRFDGEDVCNLVVVIYRDDGSEVRYAMRVYRAQIDAVTEAEIESFAAKLAQRRYERDIAAYTRVMFSDDDLQYLRDE
jgi:hypothetical protein